ncbi:MAG: response regulator [Candidatus Sulfotelmatobacter sp.]|jgi:DNA-binding response OmpR family regulator
MIPDNSLVVHKVLLVDDDDAVRGVMKAVLEHKGFEVVAAANVTEALKHIAGENFDVLITDLHMPNPGDGFTVITAMRHSQPNALTLLVSGYPDVEGAMSAILLAADEIMVKPFDVAKLADLIREKMLNRKPAPRLEKERVGAILRRSVASVVENWLTRAKQSKELNVVPLSDDERTGHLPRLVEDLIVRLSKPSATAKDSDAVFSAAALEHGKLRHQQGYTPAMLVHESRILQVTLFGTLQSNLRVLDFSRVLPDVMTIADEVDAQLTQSMDSYMDAMRTPAAA